MGGCYRVLGFCFIITCVTVIDCGITDFRCLLCSFVWFSLLVMRVGLLLMFAMFAFAAEVWWVLGVLILYQLLRFGCSLCFYV